MSAPWRAFSFFLMLRISAEVSEDTSVAVLTYPPLTLSDGTPSIDVSAYATKEWVTKQYPDLSEVSY